MTGSWPPIFVGLALLLLAACQSTRSIPLGNGRFIPLGTDRPGQRRHVAASPAPTATNPPRPQGAWTILKLDSGPALVEDCQGGLLSGITSYWIPTKAQVEEMDRALAELLSRQVDEQGHRLGVRIRSYYRQYLGVVSEGRSLVYVSGLDVEETESYTQRSRAFGEHFDWRTKTMLVCGGGDLFFRAAYDPVERKFVAFRLNAPV